MAQSDLFAQLVPPVHEHLIMGTCGWAYKDWVGSFYPPKTRPDNYLGVYSELLRAVEIDSSFYAIPLRSTVETWAHQVPEGFCFAPKMVRRVTHDHRLRECGPILDAFFDSLSALGDALGPICLQFDHTFRIEELPLLEDFLQQLPLAHRYAVEIRHRSWYTSQFYSVLQKCGVALVLNDLYYMPRMAVTTTDFVYIRLLGNRKAVPDDFSHPRINRDKELAHWCENIWRFLDGGLKVYVFVNNRYQGHAPATTRELMERLRGRP
jgi:uncharacterized protein YecE (DUF72 family)